MIEADPLREAIGRAMFGKAPEPKPIPAKLYDQIKRLGWDVRAYTRKPEPQKEEA
jgi:hypothetical protein